ncbi:hypothetical protein ACGFNU_23610 [Spirillospora sp. NPDC048911]|uniref:hypothetical protein n=1 Tax=Spirillospora sp. NPDC048911 TaxID=3364527 RepID=UPI0037167565
MTIERPRDHGADTPETVAPRAAPCIGRWQLPDGRSTAAHARRTIHAALRRWGLGPAADTLTNQMASLLQDLTTRVPTRGPLELRLELRAADRLLLGEIQSTAPDERFPTGNRGRSIIALTYGHRPARNGTVTWYTHAFTWSLPGGVPAGA